MLVLVTRYSVQNDTANNKTRVVDLMESMKAEIHEEFDWKFYLSYHEDLSRSVPHTEFDALKHFTKHGLYEYRLASNNLKPLWEIVLHREKKRTERKEDNEGVQLLANSSFSITRRGYVSFLPSRKYLPALEVFLYTLANTYTRYPVVLCVPAGIASENDIEEKALKILKKYPRLSYALYRVQNLESPCTSEVREHKRQTVNWTKLGIWKLTNFEVLFYIDLDVVVLQNVEQAFDIFDKRSVEFLGTENWGRHTPVTEHKLNRGVFLFRPSTTMFNDLVAMSRATRVFGCREAEQGLLNFRFFSQDFCCLPFEFNAQKALSQVYPVMWNISSIKILHFVGEKPWTSWSNSQFRRIYVNSEELKRLDQWDADEFTDIHRMWKRLYLESRSSEFQNLTVYQMYHDKKCWTGLLRGSLFRHVCLRGPMHSKRDLDAVRVVPALAQESYQLALGEFGGMLAMETVKNTLSEFVGILSWKYFIKETWREGASIDFTKIDFDRRKMYFWYGIYSKVSFYDTVDFHHKGLVDVFNRTLGIVLPPLGPRFYAYGNYFIMHKSQFLNYVESARAVYRKYHKLCVETSSNNCYFYLGLEPKDRKFGYLLERYINIWVANNGLQSIYAVDSPQWRVY